LEFRHTKTQKLHMPRVRERLTRDDAVSDDASVIEHENGSRNADAGFRPAH
jgi:hypothetical protein